MTHLIIIVELGPNRVMSEIVLDGGGRFSPAGIDGLHTLSLLLASQAAHDRAAGNIIETHIRAHSNTERGYSTSLDREVLTPSPCE